MSIFYGNGDLSTAKEFEGMYVSSCGNYWSNIPFTEEHEKQLKRHEQKTAWKNKIAKLRKGREFITEIRDSNH